MRFTRRLEGNLEALGYADKFPQVIDRILEDVYKGKKDDFNIPLENGEIEIYGSGKKERESTLEMFLQVTDEQKKKLFEKIPNYKIQMADSLELTLNTVYKDGDDSYFLRQVIDGIGVNFSVKPVFPKELTKRKNYKINEIEGYRKFDKEKFKVGLKIAKEFEKMGFNTKVVNNECVKQICVFPKENLSRDGIVEIIGRHPGEIEISAKNYRPFEKTPRQELNFSVFNKINEVSCELIYRGFCLDNEPSNLLLDILKTMGVKIDKQQTISCTEYTFAWEKFVDGICNLADGVAGKVRCGIKKIKERRERKEKIILNRLEEAGVVKEVDGESCILFIDESSLLKRDKRKRFN